MSSLEPKGHVTVKIEAFNEYGTRINIECFSVLTAAFLDLTTREWSLNMRQACERTRKEILTPTPKTDMA